MGTGHQMIYFMLSQNPIYPKFMLVNVVCNYIWMNLNLQRRVIPKEVRCLDRIDHVQNIQLLKWYSSHLSSRMNRTAIRYLFCSRLLHKAVYLF